MLHKALEVFTFANTLMETTIKGKNPAKSKTVISAENILIKGARVHNLKNVTVEIPRNKLIVVTGV